MDLSLTRIDLVHTDTTNRKCLRVLPNGKKQAGRAQKVVVGDQSGAVTCFGMKRGDVSTVFKAGMERGVSRIELGGAAEERDKIFVAAGQTIRAWSRKGREFLKFNTNLSEDICSMHVLGDDIYTGGEYMYNQFTDCKDAHSLMANDRINDLTAVAISPRSPTLYAVLGCQDRAVRVVQGASVVYEGAVDGPVLTLAAYGQGAGAGPAGGGPGPGFNAPGLGAAKAPGDAAQLLYGTENGIVGQLLLDETAMRRGWEVGGRSLAALGEPGSLPGARATGRRAGGVTALSSHDLTRDGVPDVLVGRDDGALQVLSFDVSAQPAVCFETTLSGSVTAAEGGLVNSAHFDEVVVSTYAGAVASLSSQPSAQIDLAGDDGAGADEEGGKGGLLRGRGKEPASGEGGIGDRLAVLRMELEALEKQLASERAKYASNVSADMIAVHADLRLRDSFALASDEACHRLLLELSRPVDFVLLRSDVPMEVMDALHHEVGGTVAAQAADDHSNAIISRTPAGPGGRALLATYRVPDRSPRVELRLRTIEGRYGLLQAYVVPHASPKTALARTYQIKPLSLHQRLPGAPSAADLAARPMSELRISGSFSVAEMHSWIAAALPEVPERVPGDEVSYTFRSSLLGTLLTCAYSRGEGLVRSDNLTALTTLKEAVAREASSRKQQIRTAMEVDRRTVGAMLRRVDPLLRHQTSLSHRVRLLEPLEELVQQEGNASFLHPDYQDALAKAQTIRQEHAQMPRQLEYLIGVVADLYVDKAKLKGRGGEERLAALDRLIRTEYSLEALLDFFDEQG